MKFCLLVTIALDIFIKEKNNTLYLPWISPLSFFYAKGVYSVNLSRKVPTLLTNFRPPQIFQPPPPPALIISYTNFQPPLLIRTPPLPVYSGP